MRYTFRQIRTSVSHLTLAIYTTRILSAHPPAHISIALGRWQTEEINNIPKWIYSKQFIIAFATLFPIYLFTGESLLFPYRPFRVCWGVNASGADVQAIGQKPAGSAGRLQTEVAGFIPAAQLPTEALAEDPSMEPQNEDLDIVDRLVEVKDGYECGEGDKERGRLLQPLQVKGNLRRNLDFWIHIGAPKFILSVIANGYCLPFQFTPVCFSLNNNKSA